jgi:hypothetical protein
MATKTTFIATSSSGEVVKRTSANNYAFCVISIQVLRDRVNGGHIAGSEKIIAEWSSRIDLAEKVMNKNLAWETKGFDGYYIASEIVPAVALQK